MKRLIILPLILLFSCTKTVYIPIREVVSEIEYKEKVVKDSIYLKDTTTTLSKGDTIYIEKVREVFRFQHISDTAYIHKIDTIPYIQEVEKVKSVTPKWAWYSLVFSIISIAVIIVYICRKVRNLRL